MLCEVDAPAVARQCASSTPCCLGYRPEIILPSRGWWYLKAGSHLCQRSDNHDLMPGMQLMAEAGGAEVEGMGCMR